MSLLLTLGMGHICCKYSFHFSQLKIKSLSLLFEKKVRQNYFLLNSHDFYKSLAAIHWSQNIDIYYNKIFWINVSFTHLTCQEKPRR